MTSEVLSSLHGRYWNFSITTSFSCCRVCQGFRKMYRFMRTDSLPGAGTPDVKTCSATTGSFPPFPDPRTVLNEMLPGSQRKEFASNPLGIVNRNAFSGT